MGNGGLTKQSVAAALTSTPARHTYLIAGLAVAVAIALVSFREVAYSMAERLKPAQPTSAVISEAESWLKVSGYSEREQARLRQQIGEIRDRRKHHLETMATFYNNYFMSLSMALLTGTVASICLVVITRRGWASTNPYIITTFVVLSGCASLFALQPAIYKQDQNVGDNKALYLAYVGLQNEALSAIATGSDRQGQSLGGAALIHYLDAELARLNNVAVGFDTTRVPLPVAQQPEK
jgi:hypothetical protein